ncbi:hypothetical protein [Caballeronia grimmiae]|uniref:hypothetical protein n=1 Tax=Caballeronia grimmiae TaxID=1071679 RepID=UPI001E3045CF|nr:hypothetical protein [Caballeronia grimmiae]
MNATFLSDGPAESRELVRHADILIEDIVEDVRELAMQTMPVGGKRGGLSLSQSDERAVDFPGTRACTISFCYQCVELTGLLQPEAAPPFFFDPRHTAACACCRIPGGTSERERLMHALVSQHVQLRCELSFAAGPVGWQLRYSLSFPQGSDDPHHQLDLTVGERIFFFRYGVHSNPRPGVFVKRCGGRHHACGFGFA